MPVTKEGGHIMQPKDVIKFVDENTIGIFVILGSTYTGGFENVQEMNDLCMSRLLPCNPAAANSGLCSSG